MDVLHILPQIVIGGMENQVRRLAAALGEVGVTAYVHACSGGNLELWSGEPFPVSCDPGGGGVVGRILRTRRLIKRLDPDIIHIHLSLSGYLAARLARAPRIVSHYHNIYPGSAQIPALELRFWKAFDRFCSGDLSIACSEAVLHQCVAESGIDPTRVEVLRNGVDLRSLDELSLQSPDWIAPCSSPSEVRLVFVGRLVPQKGLDVLIRSLAVLHPAEWHLMIVGDGPLRAELQELVRNHGLEPRVTFYGARPWQDIPGLLAVSDLFVYPSRWEGLGLSIVEASACRLPVVATDVGGIPEVVLGGVTGLLVPPGDPEALASALAQLLDDPVRRREMGEAGRVVVEEKFDIRKIAAQAKGIYEQLLQD